MISLGAIITEKERLIMQLKVSYNRFLVSIPLPVVMFTPLLLLWVPRLLILFW